MINEDLLVRYTKAYNEADSNYAISAIVTLLAEQNAKNRIAIEYLEEKGVPIISIQEKFNKYFKHELDRIATRLLKE
ncbi:MULTISPECIES: hypothetical protein [Clostridium]|uniref:Uncharacterized protein n=1 Tax=Clostridium beijerinckii TaxID=1520 RepID=A0A1S9N692_CLOBE|nr:MULTISPECIES: hypothetical protein [Clostridium]EKQ54869.1 MAG: hypothetical protein A370_03022 [Clostridium sp. Maddingley MBC34-26]MZK53975.1 hypothetical protein [Clostridium beijerinckii]MZK62067.1 hypothetical protein [Clostridium beijerinckii]MZK72287.1 hypothetical protein [Clostridium beijerinckii]MZK77682.1 hypothetical protein [Clostridium beijerinckii]